MSVFEGGRKSFKNIKNESDIFFQRNDRSVDPVRNIKNYYNKSSIFTAEIQYPLDEDNKPHRNKFKSDFVPKMDEQSALQRKIKEFSMDHIGNPKVASSNFYNRSSSIGNFNKEIYM